MKLTSTNPASNYQPIGQVDVSTAADVADKVAKARAALGAWKALGVQGRVELLRPIQAEFRRRSGEIAELISRETGKALAESTAEVVRYTDIELDWFLDNAAAILADDVVFDDDESTHRVVYEPHGVVAAIAPWNFPFGMAVWGIFPNLIVGNTVVFKTSEECPLVGKLIEEIIRGQNLPEGVFSEVYGAGNVGKLLAEERIDLIWFTGSTATGKSLYKTAADKFIKVVLEMGGSSPCVVFDDVDAAEVAPVIYSGRFQHSGQVCSALKRLIVHEDVAEKLIAELGQIMERQKIGDPLSKDTDKGSLVAERQLTLLQAQYDDAITKGAKIAAQTRIDGKLRGAFFPHILLTNITKDMRVWKEEVFGPVFPIVTFKTEAEAVALANDTPYGLTARVVSADTERANRVASQIDAGSVSINLEARFLPSDPFGGYKNSGMGRERGAHGLRELCQIKVIQVRKEASVGEG